MTAAEPKLDVRNGAARRLQNTDATVLIPEPFMSILSSVAPVISMAHARHAHSGPSGTPFSKLLSGATVPAASTPVVATGRVSGASGGLQHVLDLLQGH